MVFVLLFALAIHNANHERPHPPPHPHRFSGACYQTMAVNIAFLLLVGFFVAHLFHKIRLPGLLGMLLTGVLCGPYVFNILHPQLLHISADLRMVALIILLLRAGLGLHKKILVQVGFRALRMALIPVTLEGAVVAGLAHQLFAIPPMESLLLASVVVAISPAIVVPFMLETIQRRLGTAKAIPSLILSAAAVEVVFVVVLFTLLLGMQGDTDGNTLWQLLKIPESMIFGVMVGWLAGLALHHLFKRWRIPLTKRTLILIALSILLTWLETLLKPHIALSALLSMMTMGFILLEKDPQVAQALSQQLTKIWTFAEVLLYVLVGAQVNIHVAWDAGMLGALLIVLGLAARSLATWFCVGGTHFNRKERLFCVIAYLPKATVPAALAAIPLERGIPSGEIILAVAVLAIIIAAPLGVIGLDYARPRCLQKEE